MPRFHFHVLDDLDAPDLEGRKLVDFDVARAVAIREARQLVGDTVKEGHLRLRHRIDIEDPHGNGLDSIVFGDVIAIS